MKSIRLMLVDGQEAIRTITKTPLESCVDFTVIAEANNGQDAIIRALGTRPDIILMDITMPIMNGLDATCILKSQWDEAAVLALAEHDDLLFLCLTTLVFRIHYSKFTTVFT